MGSTTVVQDPTPMIEENRDAHHLQHSNQDSAGESNRVLHLLTAVKNEAKNAVLVVIAVLFAMPKSTTSGAQTVVPTVQARILRQSNAILVGLPVTNRSRAQENPLRLLLRSLVTHAEDLDTRLTSVMQIGGTDDPYQTKT